MFYLFQDDHLHNTIINRRTKKLSDVKIACSRGNAVYSIHMHSWQKSTWLTKHCDTCDNKVHMSKHTILIFICIWVAVQACKCVAVYLWLRYEPEILAAPCWLTSTSTVAIVKYSASFLLCFNYNFPGSSASLLCHFTSTSCTVKQRSILHFVMLFRTPPQDPSFIFSRAFAVFLKQKVLIDLIVVSFRKSCCHYFSYLSRYRASAHVHKGHELLLVDC